MATAQKILHRRTVAKQLADWTPTSPFKPSFRYHGYDLPAPDSKRPQRRGRELSFSWFYTSDGWKWPSPSSTRTARTNPTSSSTGSSTVTSKWGPCSRCGPCWSDFGHFHCYVSRLKVSHVMEEGLNMNFEGFTWKDTFPWLFKQDWTSKPKEFAFTETLKKGKKSKIRLCTQRDMNCLSSTILNKNACGTSYSMEGGPSFPSNESWIFESFRRAGEQPAPFHIVMSYACRMSLCNEETIFEILPDSVVMSACRSLRSSSRSLICNRVFFLNNYYYKTCIFHDDPQFSLLRIG